jgi:Cu-processing system ATP-binding protein
MIRFTEVTKRFGATLAVDRLTLSIRPGEVVALLGPNGSGKTTTLKMAAGLVRPDGGTVSIGEPPRPSSDPSARRALSFLPQRVAFPEALTGREVVEFYRRLRAAEPARSAAVLHFASLNGAGERAVGTYSGGMVQRLGLAVAMLPDVDMLLLDEPTAALDPAGLEAFYALVGDRRAHGRAVLFTSHQVSDVERLADRVVVMANGRLAGEFTRERLRAWRDAHGVMRVRLDRPADDVIGAVRRLVPAAAAQGDEVLVPGSAAERASVLEVIRSVGAGVTGLTAEDGRLEVLYADLLAGAGDRGRHA